MDMRQREREQMICGLRSDKEKLESHLSKMTEDLHRCMRALHAIASVEMGKDDDDMRQVLGTPKFFHSRL